MSNFAHNGYGKSLFSLGRYDEAMAEFEYAFNRTEYSNAFWEVRNLWISSFIGYVFAGAALLWLISAIAKRALAKARKSLPKSRKPQSRLLRDILFLGNVLKHPLDTFYDLKVGKRGSIASASILYLAAYIAFVSSALFEPFLFRAYYSLSYVSAVYVIGIFFVPCALWVFANYMVSSINEGEGSLKNVYICTAYAFAPLITLMPAVIAFCYFCTFNEIFLVDAAHAIVIGWTAVCFLLMVYEVHGFSFLDMAKNVLLTLFAIICAVTAFAVCFLLAKQAASFIADVFREVIFRAS
jgi:hypothetical protein